MEYDDAVVLRLSETRAGGMLLRGRAALPSSCPHMAAGVQSDVAEDGRAGGTHRGPDHRPSGSGLRRGGRLTCAGNSSTLTPLITLMKGTRSSESSHLGEGDL